jgi:hypothetical protein
MCSTMLVSRLQLRLRSFANKMVRSTTSSGCSDDSMTLVFARRFVCGPLFGVPDLRGANLHGRLLTWAAIDRGTLGSQRHKAPTCLYREPHAVSNKMYVQRGGIKAPQIYNPAIISRHISRKRLQFQAFISDPVNLVSQKSRSVAFRPYPKRCSTVQAVSAQQKAQLTE